MQRRTLWVILSIISIVVVLCVAVSAASFATLRYLGTRLSEQIPNLEITPQSAESIQQNPLIDPTAESSTPTPRPTAQPRSSASAGPSAASASGSTAPAENVASLPESDIAASLTTVGREQLAQHANAPVYRIAATFDPDAHTIAGQQRLRYTNAEDTPLSEVYFRLYINAPFYEDADMRVTNVRVGDAPVVAELSDDDTTLRIPLAQPLAPGQSIDLRMDFSAAIPTNGFALFSDTDGVFTLYYWHPELAVYENGAWLLPPVVEQGDSSNTDAANYDVTFVAPSDFTVVTGGVDVGSQPIGDAVAHTSVSALGRNFVVVASDQFERAEEKVDETTVASYYLPGSQQGSQTALQTAARSIRLYGERFGPYPYTEMDVAQVQFGGIAGGMESTGLVMLEASYYDPAQSNVLGDTGVFPGDEGANMLVHVTAHEVAHQWWYGVVGNDAYAAPWLDESLTNWSAAFYADETEGKDAGLMTRDLFISLPYVTTLDGGDVRLDQPVDAFSGDEYAAIVYGKGALMYDVLRQEIGDQAFFAFLQRYYREQSFDRATQAEWLQTLSQAAGKDMQPFYDKWVEGTSITANDLPPGGPLGQIFGGGSGGLDDLLVPPTPSPSP